MPHHRPPTPGAIAASSLSHCRHAHREQPEDPSRWRQRQLALPDLWERQLGDQVEVQPMPVEAPHRGGAGASAAAGGLERG